MHSLVGVYVKEQKEETLEGGVTLYPFKLFFPGNKGRSYYLIVKEERDNWIKAIKNAIGYANMDDFYEIKKDIGKGKFG